MNYFTKIKNAVKTKLNSWFVRLTHATSDTPLVIEPAPEPKVSRWKDAQWLPVKEALLEGQDLVTNKDGSENKTKRDQMGQLLENLRKTLRQFEETSPNQAQNSATLSKIILPVCRSWVPNLIAWDIVGVQTMKGPVDQVFVLKRHSSSGTGVEEGKAVGMGFQILKETVEAKTRKMSARWTFEFAETAKSIPGVDLEVEIMSALAQEFGAEVDQELLRYLRTTAKAHSMKVKWDWDNLMTTTQQLVIAIHKQSAYIAKRTRRGAGNWAVLSPSAYTLLKTHSEFLSAPEEIEKRQAGVTYKGMLNKSIKIYVDPWASEDAPVLVGYKGVGEIDAGVIFCPYAPLLSSGVIIDPKNFEPIVSFMTRYGMYEMAEVARAPAKAADYYGLIEFSPVKKSSDD